MSQSVTVATLAENREPMLREVYWLFHSLRTFGGRLSGAKAIVYFVDSVPKETSHLEALEVETRLVPTIEPRSPHCNKIHMLLDDYETDWLVALDTDTIITGDFSDYLNKPVVCAKIVDGNPLTEELWRKLYSYFALNLPKQRYLTHFHAVESNPYFNSGVLLIPGSKRAVLGKAWLKLVPEVMTIYPFEPELAKHSFFTDQFAFALALTKANLAYRVLPLDLNFPTHIPIHPMFVTSSLSPLILHHHHKVNSEGKIKHCDYPVVNELIDRFNTSLAADGCVPYCE